MSQWLAYSEKFSNTTAREQYLIIASGLVAIIFILYTLFMDASILRIEQLNQQISQSQQSIENNKNSMQVLEQALREDPNVILEKELAQYQEKLGGIDQQLLALTSDLIDPIQMRYALIKLLKLQKGVKLLSFQVLPASAVTKNKAEVDVKLQGQYFQLKDYLTQLEGLSWKFFWQEFDYQLKTYPVSELEIEIYSLSTAQEFIGV